MGAHDAVYLYSGQTLTVVGLRFCCQGLLFSVICRVGFCLNNVNPPEVWTLTSTEVTRAGVYLSVNYTRHLRTYTCSECTSAFEVVFLIFIIRRMIRMCGWYIIIIITSVADRSLCYLNQGLPTDFNLYTT